MSKWSTPKYNKKTEQFESVCIRKIGKVTKIFPTCHWNGCYFFHSEMKVVKEHCKICKHGI